MKTIILTILLSISIAGLAATKQPKIEPFAKGADISWLPQMEASGYKFYNENELNLFLNKLTKLKIDNILELWHLNDSRDEFDSGHYRHANIGQGKININEFKTILNHPKTKNFPFIIETPGFDNKGPDKKNLDILKLLV